MNIAWTYRTTVEKQLKGLTVIASRDQDWGRAETVVFVLYLLFYYLLFLLIITCIT